MPDYAARIRAARAFKDLTQQELADALGVEVQTIKRREGGSQEPKKGERLAISQICGVPAEFLEDGFGGRAESEISERLEVLEDRLREMQRELVLREVEEPERTGSSGQRAGRPQRGRPQ